MGTVDATETGAEDLAVPGKECGPNFNPAFRQPGPKCYHWGVSAVFAVMCFFNSQNGADGLTALTSAQFYALSPLLVFFQLSVC